MAMEVKVMVVFVLISSATVDGIVGWFEFSFFSISIFLSFK